MRVIDYIGMAGRNLSRQKTRTFLTIVAITVGSLSLILMASLIISIKQSLTEQFQQLGAFNLVSVSKDPNSTNSNSLLGSSGDPSEGKLIDETTLTAMKKLPHVVQAAGVVSNFGINTMRLDGQAKKTWASLVGFDPRSGVFNLPVAFGRLLTSSDQDAILVGSRFVDEMGFSSHPQDLVGKQVLLAYRMGGVSAPDWGALPVKPPVNADRAYFEAQGNASLDIPVTIVGVLKGSPIDDGSSYLNLAWAHRLLTNVRWDHTQCQGDPRLPNGQEPCSNNLVLTKEDQFARQGYGSIVLKADDQANIAAIATSVKALGYGATTAQAMLDQINQILSIITAVLAVIGGISLFVATIGIVNTMVMATYERTREIGVMRACGATRATIRRLFTIEAGLLGFWGGITGLVVSVGLTKFAGVIVHKYGASLGQLPLDHIGNFPLWLIVAVVSFTTLLGMFSGLFPAIRAARLNPVDALRYE